MLHLTALTLGAINFISAQSTAQPSVSHIPLSTKPISPALPTNTPVPDDNEPTIETNWCKSPIYCSGEILQKIALSELYPDGKTFVDKPTKVNEEEVLESWSKVNNGNQDNVTVGQIKEFVEKNFGPEGGELVAVELQNFNKNPPFVDEIKDELVKGFAETVHSYWPRLLRRLNTSATCDNESCETTLLDMPDTFVVPGGRFKEMYYSDTYFALKGMLLSGLNNEVKQVLNNFIVTINNYGFIPNGLRSYYLNRSHPPYFGLMVDDYVTATNDTDFLNIAIPAIEKELEWWNNNRMSEVTSPFSGKTHRIARYNVINSAPRPEVSTAYSDLL